MADFDTQSERDFYEFCHRQNWRAEKRPQSNELGVRSPDFIVKTGTGYEFITEVTEFKPLPPLDHGEIRHRRQTLGNPLRAKLHEKKGQVKAHANKFPTLIVISGGLNHSAELDSISFDSALYGELAVAVTVPINPRNSPQIDDETHNAGRRFFGPNHNTSVSAVASLNGLPQILRIYHNKFAKSPLDPSRLSFGTEKVEHFTKLDDGLTGWQRIV